MTLYVLITFQSLFNEFPCRCEGIHSSNLGILNCKVYSDLKELLAHCGPLCGLIIISN